MARILVVDDEAVNRELIQAYLEGSGHVLVEAASGQEALAITQKDPPDLVLLDVMMAGMNGFDTTLKLKAQSGDTYLPIVLLTALRDQSSRTLGLQVGADEFITKPVDRWELTVRMNNLLALRNKELALHRQNTELIELHRFKEEMAGLIVHDLKNPMSVVLANYEYLGEELKTAGAPILEAIEDSHTAAKRIMRLLANLLDLSRLEAKRLELQRVMIRPGALLSSVVSQRRLAAGARMISLDTELDEISEVQADPDLIVRVMENIFDNALRHTPSGGRIEVRCSTFDAGVHIDIGNTGPRVPPEARSLIFEKYGQSSATNGRMNLGLGLYFCRLALESHGGRIWVDETPSLPTIFKMELPALAPIASV